MSRLRVGVIGANAGRSWAAVAHVPALQALEGFEISAVGTRSMQTARAAADQFGVGLAFDDAGALARSPEVDVIAVSVNAPAHEAVLKAVLETGKPVFCEWPICSSLDASRDMAAVARAKGVVSVMGLQSRVAPVFQYVRDLLAQGHVGRVLSSSMSASWRIWGEATPAFNIYTRDAANGASALHIAGGHTLDTLQTCLGRFTSLSAATRVQRDTGKVLETGEVRPFTSVQQFALHGAVESGALVSVHLQGGTFGAGGLRWEINGTDGDLLITTPETFGVTSPTMRLQGTTTALGAFEDMTIPDRYLQAPPGLTGSRALATAHLYQALATAIRTGERARPDFEDGLALHELIGAIERSSAEGRRIDL